MDANHETENGDVFVRNAKGTLKLFKAIRSFGLISPVWRTEKIEESASKQEELWFFGNHNLPSTIQPGVVLSFEVCLNSEGKAFARSVHIDESSSSTSRGEDTSSFGNAGAEEGYRQHANEPRTIYPSVYVSDIPMDYSEDTLRELHRKLGVNPDMIVGFKYLPSKLGKAGDGTGCVIVRYGDDDAANAAVERLRGHPIRLSSGAVKYVGARHAAPAQWMAERRQFEQVGLAPVKERPPPPKQPKESQVKEPWEDMTPKQQTEHFRQKIRGCVQRISAAGYGVIKHAEFGEVMWREYELPMDTRLLQFNDPQQFQIEVQSRPDYQRLKDMEGKEIEAELYQTPDGQYRANNVKVLNGGSGVERSLEPLLPSLDPPPPPPPAASHAPQGNVSSGTPSVPAPNSSSGPLGSWAVGDASQQMFYKTQPCPYLMQGMCTMGYGCFYAHSPEELRPPPGYMPEKKHKEKKEKKDKKEKRKGKRSHSDDNSCGNDRDSGKRPRRDVNDNDL